MQNKNEITTLFLDIGGVLLSDGWGHDFRRLTAEKFELDLPEMEIRPVFHSKLLKKGNLPLLNTLTA